MQPEKKVTTERVRWWTDRTDEQHRPTLSPVRLGAEAISGAFHIQDYLTPDEARQLAAGLVAAADAAECEKFEQAVAEGVARVPA